MTFETWEARLELLIGRGRRRGFVTVEEVNMTLPDQGVSAEFIEHVLRTLSEAGVNVVESESEGGTEDDEVAPRDPRGPLSPTLRSGAEAPLDTPRPEDDFVSALGADLSVGGQSEVRK